MIRKTLDEKRNEREFVLIADLETLGLKVTDSILEIGLILCQVRSLEDAEPGPLITVIDRFASYVEPAEITTVVPVDDPMADIYLVRNRKQYGYELDRVIAAAGPIVAGMHEKSRLWAGLRQPRPPASWQVDYAVNLWLDHWKVPASKVMLAGSGVAQFDIGVIREQMPVLSARLHYRSFDVSPFSEIMRAFAGREIMPSEEIGVAGGKVEHRALVDCEQTLARLIEWQDFLLARM